jgi:glutathione synthase
MRVLPVRFLYVMDPIARVDPEKDTTYAFLRAAQVRGHEAFHCLARDVWVKGGDIGAIARSMKQVTHAPWAEFGSPVDVRMDEIDCVFVRKDPPFDDEYLYATLLLEHAREKTLVINDPRGLRDANEKLYATHFPDLMPRFLVTSNRDKIHAFVDEVGGKGVLKPLDGAGGASVMMVVKGDANARSIVDTITSEGTRLSMIQEYLPAVRQGDKRILLLEGKLLGAINRVPREDDLRSNIHVGGKVVPTKLTAREEEIVSIVGPRLVKDGLIFVGLDVIGDRLTEVNVTSPTGIQELSRHMGRDVAADVIEWVERHAGHDRRPH